MDVYVAFPPSCNCWQPRCSTNRKKRKKHTWLCGWFHALQGTLWHMQGHFYDPFSAPEKLMLAIQFFFQQQTSQQLVSQPMLTFYTFVLYPICKTCCLLSPKHQTYYVSSHDDPGIVIPTLFTLSGSGYFSHLYLPNQPYKTSWSVLRQLAGEEPTFAVCFAGGQEPPGFVCACVNTETLLHCHCLVNECVINSFLRWWLLSRKW